ncbi:MULTISPECIES: hypothetical protein [Anaeromyxobacter]|uniref:hypothetical protein n=1 Tax=Anaeromyxobacter TaxID=161492 RepID=UPI001F55C718|nr:MULTISPECIES: hypothetical protein [unclassified Anaeromyxobacter]
MLRRPPQSVVLAIASAGVVGAEALALGVWCVRLLGQGEAMLRSAATAVLCLLVAGGIVAFIRGALLQRPDVRMTAVGWTMPIAACLGVFAMLIGLVAALLSARTAALPLLAFALVVVLPIGTIGVALLRPSARAWFDAGAERERRSRRA